MALKPTLRHQLPHSTKAEAGVLGGILLDSSIMDDVLEELGKNLEDTFYDDAHRTIFEAMLNLWRKGKVIDTVTLCDELRRLRKLDVVGGEEYIEALLDEAPSAAHAPIYARNLKEKRILRDVIQVAEDTIKEAILIPDDIQRFLDQFEKRVMEITNESSTISFTSTCEFDISELIKGDRMRGVPTGFKSFDKLTGGLQPSDFIIIAARPSMGKTSLALNLAKNVALLHKIPVGIFSLEMSTEMLLIRLLCMEGLVDISKTIQKSLAQEEKERIFRAAKKLSQAPVYINDSVRSISQIKAAARKLRKDKQIGLVIIDFIQQVIVPWRMDSKEQEISYISGILKALAKDLEIPVVAISQLSRNPERRGGDRRPQLADLRESGALEQDADLVVLLYREEYYNRCSCITPDGTPLPECRCGRRGKTELTIAKQRNGPTGSVMLYFRKEFGLFEDTGIGLQI